MLSLNADGVCQIINYFETDRVRYWLTHWQRLIGTEARECQIYKQTDSDVHFSISETYNDWILTDNWFKSRY